MHREEVELLLDLLAHDTVDRVLSHTVIGLEEQHGAGLRTRAGASDTQPGAGGVHQVAQPLGVGGMVDTDRVPWAFEGRIGEVDDEVAPTLETRDS